MRVTKLKAMGLPHAILDIATVSVLNAVKLVRNSLSDPLTISNSWLFLVVTKESLCLKGLGHAFLGNFL